MSVDQIRFPEIFLDNHNILQRDIAQLIGHGDPSPLAPSLRLHNVNLLLRLILVESLELETLVWHHSGLRKELELVWK